MKTKAQIKARLKEIVARNKALAAKSEFTPEETAEINDLAKEAAGLQARLTALATGEIATEDPEEDPVAEDPAADPEEDPAPEDKPTASNKKKIAAALAAKGEVAKKLIMTGGFAHVGQFAMAVMGSGREESKRLAEINDAFKALNGGNTQVPREGGYAVPTEFATEILQLMKGTNGIMPLCFPLKTGGGDFEQAVDPNEPWSASGVQTGYLDELADMPIQKPDLKLISIKLAEAGALVKLSNRVMKDAAMLASSIRGNVPQRLNSFLTKQILTGDGVGRHFVGAIGHASEVVVNAVASQGAGTIVCQNIADMYARVPVDQQNKFVWLHHPLALPQLLMLRDPSGNPLVQWNNSFRDGPGQFTLLGRPLVACEWCSALGTKGDIVAFSGDGYGLLTRTGTEATLEESMHVFFNSNSHALRFVLDIGGAPLWPNAGVYPSTSGTGKFSPIVTLNSTRT